MIKIGLIDKKNLPQYLSYFDQLDLNILLGGLSLVGIFRSIALYFVSQAARVFLEIFNLRMRLLCFFEILKKNSGTFVPSSRVNYLVSEIFPKAGQFIFYSSITLSHTIQILGLGIGLFWVAWKEASIGVSGLVVLGFIIKKINSKLLSISSEVPKAQFNINRSIERILRNWILVKVSKIQSQEYDRIVSSTLLYGRRIIHAGHLANFSGVLPPAFGIIFLAFIIVVSQRYFGTKSLNLLMFLYLFLRFTQLVGSAAIQYSHALSYFSPFREAARYFFTFTKGEVYSAIQPLVAGKISDNYSSGLINETHYSKCAHSMPPSVILENIHFNWTASDENKLFSGLNLNLSSGEVLGIVGPSGVGKSTLLNLILGQIKADAGTIRINGQKPERYLDECGDRVAYVGADPFIIAGTIRDNLAYGLKNPVNDDLLWKSLSFGRIESLIRSLPDQIEHKLNEIGEGLSTGQKQRLALARAWLRNPVLWILDEATANLDFETEKQIVDTFMELKGKATILIVTHRKPLLELTDKMLDLSSIKSLDLK